MQSQLPLALQNIMLRQLLTQAEQDAVCAALDPAEVASLQSEFSTANLDKMIASEPKLEMSAEHLALTEATTVIVVLTEEVGGVG